MDKDKLLSILGKLDPKWVKIIERYLHKIPSIHKELDAQTNEIMTDIEPSVRPYQTDFTTYRELPKKGIDRAEIMATIANLSAKESGKWQEGRISGAVYSGDLEHINFLNEVYALNSQTNPLHADVFPSVVKYEAEIISMTAGMLGASNTADEICGSVSSGGTESILLAMKTYRDWARKEKGIRRPEMVVPLTAHAAFNKAAEYFNIKLRPIPVDKDLKADMKAVRKAINRNTIVLVGSAPTFPHGMIDPIKEMSELALSRNIGMHVDACLGGFILPWAKKLGYDIPEFDFSLPGVTSISVDTHKYGYAAKGNSVILYRGKSLRAHQYFTISDWPGGLYFSPTFAGSRPGALSAMCWATLISIGEEGYLRHAERIMQVADEIKAAIKSIPELRIMGKPLWNIAFTSDQFDIYQIMDQMSERGWSLNGLHKPTCIHICVTLPQTQPGVSKRFIEDLKQSVEAVKANPHRKGGMAPVYGLAANLPLRGAVGNLLKKYMDILYKV